LKKIIFGFFVACFSAVLVGTLGTLCHRAGAELIFPYGIVAALLLCFAVGWIIRYYFTFLHTIVYAVGIVLVVLFFAGGNNFSNSALIISSGLNISAFANYVGYIWLFGSFVASILSIFFPKKLFRNDKPIEALPQDKPLDDSEIVSYDTDNINAQMQGEAEYEKKE